MHVDRSPQPRRDGAELASGRDAGGALRPATRRARWLRPSLGGQRADDRYGRVARPPPGGEREHRVAVAGGVRRIDGAGKPSSAISATRLMSFFDSLALVATRPIVVCSPGRGGACRPSSPERSIVRTSARPLPSGRANAGDDCARWPDR